MEQIKYINKYKLENGKLKDVSNDNPDTWNHFVRLEEYLKMYSFMQQVREIAKSSAMPEERLAKILKLASQETCRHDYETKNVGRCLTNYTCKKCQKSKTIDSSD